MNDMAVALQLTLIGFGGEDGWIGQGDLLEESTDNLGWVWVSSRVSSPDLVNIVSCYG
jgi:hypothetical protein